MELMIVIVIIGILATVGMVMFGGQTTKAKINTTKQAFTIAKTKFINVKKKIVIFSNLN